MFRRILEFLAEEPVAISGLVTAVFALLTAVGLVVDENIITAIGGIITALSLLVGTFLARGAVTPTAKLPNG